MSENSSSRPSKSRIWGMAPNIFFLGMVSFLTDVSSDMIFGPLFPLFLANVLLVKTTTIGFIAGVTEGFESLLKIFSGQISDRVKKRKLFAVIGYGVSTLAKPFLYFAAVWGQVLGIRLADRVGKGIRTSPRDALIADSAPEGERGKSFGFHRAMDTAGACLGLAIAACIVFFIQREALTLSPDAYRLIVLISVIPAALAVLVLFLFVREPKKDKNTEADNLQKGISQSSQEKRGFSLKFKLFLGVMALFTLGNSSDAFLSLRAQNLGCSPLFVTMMFLLHNVVYAGVSIPAGAWSDKLGRKRVILAGWVVYAPTYLGFALASAQWQVWLLFAVYGVYYGAAEGVARAFVADMVPEERRGTAYGLYHGIVGISLLAASLMAGWLWEAVFPAAPFFVGAGMAGIATIALVVLIR